jgi:hypothetical protein
MGAVRSGPRIVLLRAESDREGMNVQQARPAGPRLLLVCRSHSLRTSVNRRGEGHTALVCFFVWASARPQDRHTLVPHAVGSHSDEPWYEIMGRVFVEAFCLFSLRI